MKVPKSMLMQVVKEEVAAHVRRLLEAPDAAKVVDADDEKKDKEKEGGKGEAKPTKPSDGPVQPKQQSDKPKAAEKLPTQEPEEGETGDADAQDAEAKQDKDDKEAPGGEEEDAEDVTGGKIADAIDGKTVQSVTMEPESKILPGAQEITFTFREIPDPLKILVTKTGQVKFHFRGLHNTLGEDTQPGMDSPVPQNVNPGNVTKKTNHADKFSLSNDEYLGWLKNPPHNLSIVSAQSGKPLAKMDAAQIKWALSKAAFMKGMAKGVNSDAEYWIAPIVRKK